MSPRVKRLIPMMAWMMAWMTAWMTAGVLGVPGASAAQDVSVLTVRDALERARRNNPAYRQALNSMDLSGPAQRAAWGAFLPSLNLDLGTAVNFNRQLTGTDNFGNPIDNPVKEWRTSSGSNQGVSANLTLFEGGRRFHQLSLERAQADSRTRAAALQLTTIRAQVERQYYQTLQQSDLLLAEEGLLEGRRVDQRSAERLFGLAGASRVDVLSAELEVQRQERTVRQVQSDYDKAILALGTAMGSSDHTAFEVQGPAPVAFDPSQLPIERLVTEAVARSPRVLQEEAQRKVNAANLRSARGRRWPTITMGMGFTQRGNAFDYEGLFEPFPNESRSAYSSLSISIPVFSQFQTGSQIAQADVDLRNADQAIRLARLEVEENVRSQLIDLQSAYESLEMAERSQSIAEERLRLAREEYRLAVRRFADLQTDIAAAAAERRQVINETYAFVQALINLEETVGAPVRPGAEGGDR